MEENTMIEEQVVAETPENIDEAALAAEISSKLNYEFARAYLVKQLPAQMVTRKVKVPVDTEEVDADGNTIQEMQEKEIEMESILRTGIVLKVPYSVSNASGEHSKEMVKYNVGDRIVYRNNRAADFDLLHDSALIEQFDIICREEKKNG